MKHTKYEDWDTELVPLNDAASNNNVINVSWPERLVTSTTGAFLVSSGIRQFKRKPVRSLLRALAGGWLMYRAASGYCPVYNKLGKQAGVRFTEALNVRTQITVNKPRTEVYNFWRNLSNLPLFMRHLVAVTETDGNHSRWEARIPGGLGTIKWTAEIVKEVDGSFIGWQSISGSSIENAGKVSFTDAGEGRTEIDVIITYRPPAGDIGVTLGKLLSPLFKMVIKQDIHAFKDYIEEDKSVVKSDDMVVI